MRISRTTSRRRSQHGVSLIEVMVSVLILGIALLGIAAMQSMALRNGQSSLERSQIVAYSYSILDAMRANRDAALSGAYNLASMQCEIPPAGSLAETDLRQWILSLKDGMSADPVNDSTTCGQVVCAAGVCTITVQWDDTRARSVDAAAADAANAEGGAQRQVQTVARL
ncbi:type IV pilus modification protein PilV [Luteimonas viscosa]|uniref:Type IV pilus modification protein PilV n=1 Tax=Luteimonas viscosa TaxID=1132694 RepID=A0A5D4XUH5_9GAMM|nr:type IV pilus modification protein PilV [Luteimonas viscosa]TYT27635.1 type IV pilus modification protein PilV [Luteimonas viscosa]